MTAAAFGELDGLTLPQFRLLGKLLAKRVVDVSGPQLRALRVLVDRGLATKHPTHCTDQAHVTQRGVEVATEHFRRANAGQCPAMNGPSRGGVIVFCTKHRGHVQEGDRVHIGTRKRWT